MKTYVNIAIGMVFAIPGFFLLLAVLGVFNITSYVDFVYLFKYYWGIIFFILPGAFIHSLYFAEDKKSPGYLVSGSLLVSWGLILQLSFSFDLWTKLWPGFVFAFAVAIFENFWFCGRERAMLIAAVIVTGVSAVIFTKTMAGNFYTDYILAMVLIALGLIIMFVKTTKKELNNR